MNQNSKQESPPTTASNARFINEKQLILYDFLLVRGGAEAVTLLLYKHFKSLEIGTSFINSNAFTEEDFQSGKVTTLCEPTYVLGWQTIKTAFAFWFKKARFLAYKRIIFSGSYSTFAAFGRTNHNNILYCHTPPRFVYDLKAHYLATIPRWKRPLLRLLIAAFQPLYEKSLQNIDVIIANSVNVQQRIHKYLGRKAAVIYPPCDTKNYQWIKQGDFYLSTARVEPYKRVEGIVEAFKAMPDKKLIVASGGSALEALKESAKGYNNIHFTGWCSHEDLRRLVGECIATLYLPVDEDFGMSPVESMAAGKPCIGVNEGGVKETVLPNKTGYLCPSNPSVQDIIDAVKAMNENKAYSMRAACEQQAKRFSEEIFLSKMQQILEASDSTLAETIMKNCATKEIVQ